MPRRSARKRFHAVDDHVIVTALALTDSEILPQMLGNNDGSDDEIVIKDKPLARPSKKETENALEILQNASLYTNKFGSEMQNIIFQLKKLMNTERNSKQSTKTCNKLLQTSVYVCNWCVLIKKKSKTTTFSAQKFVFLLLLNISNSRYLLQFSDPLESLRY